MRNGLLPKILITARDPSTASAMQVLAREFIKDNQVELILASQQPATDILLTDLKFSRHIKVPSFLNDEELIEYAKKLSENIQPDVVIAGISGPDSGIDEAILAVSRRSNDSPYAVQCYWGDINEAFGAKAQTYIVIDDYAEKVTRQRIGKTCITIGSLKYQDYHKLNPVSLRKSFRKKYASQEELLIGLFTQPMEEGIGYYESIRLFAEVYSDCEELYQVILRTHPKQTEDQIQHIKNIFSELELQYIDATSESFEETLCGLDLAVSGFSTCGYDLQHLIFASEAPLGIPVYLFYNAALVNWYQNYSGLSSIPMSDNDLAVVANHPDILKSLINRKTLFERQQKTWEKVKEFFPNSNISGKMFTDIVMSNLKRENNLC